MGSGSAMDLPDAVLRQAYKYDIIFMFRSLAFAVFFFLQNLRLGSEQNRGSVKSEKKSMIESSLRIDAGPWNEDGVSV